MKKGLWNVGIVIIGALGVAAWAAQKPAGSAAGGSQVEHGRYLVESVAMCGECHTPRDSGGQIDNSRRLEGAPMWFTPVVAPPDWAYRAPALAGLPSFTDADISMILEKGLQPTGRAIRPPMHVFHMSHEDAMAIAAYLRSLPPATN
ncbi:MAG TPA: c-type cytochrome [Chthonomonadales bacterium]|nr:c-type cytochrome [Terriglobia bacterium]HEV2472348.1 c-type cytochrome [Chthonomonadales bacterium]